MKRILCQLNAEGKSFFLLLLLIPLVRQTLVLYAAPHLTHTGAFSFQNAAHTDTRVTLRKAASCFQLESNTSKSLSKARLLPRVNQPDRSALAEINKVFGIFFLKNVIFGAMCTVIYRDYYFVIGMIETWCVRSNSVRSASNCLLNNQREVQCLQSGLQNTTKLYYKASLENRIRSARYKKKILKITSFHTQKHRIQSSSK